MSKPSPAILFAIRKPNARAVVEKILETGRSLREFPRMGRMVPDLGQDAIRERFVYVRDVYR